MTIYINYIIFNYIKILTFYMIIYYIIVAQRFILFKNVYLIMFNCNCYIFIYI